MASSTSGLETAARVAALVGACGTGAAWLVKRLLSILRRRRARAEYLRAAADATRLHHAVLFPWVVPGDAATPLTDAEIRNRAAVMADRLRDAREELGAAEGYVRHPPTPEELAGALIREMRRTQKIPAPPAPPAGPDDRPPDVFAHGDTDDEEAPR